MPTSRSVTVELAPSVRTVKPEPRSLFWKAEKNRSMARADVQSGIVFSIEEYQPSNLDETKKETEEKEKMGGQVVPPPTPDILQGR